MKYYFIKNIRAWLNRNAKLKIGGISSFSVVVAEDHYRSLEDENGVETFRLHRLGEYGILPAFLTDTNRSGWHISINPNTENGVVTWLKPVIDTEYPKL